MSGIDEAIADLEDALAQRAPQNLAAGHAPISDSELAEIRARIAPLRLPESVTAVARWHDGGFCPEWPQSPWLSLAEGLEHRAALRDFAHTHADGWPVPMMPFPDQWLPVLVDGAFTLIVELHTDPRPDSPMWCYDSGGGPSLDAEHSSLERYLRVAIAKLPRPEDRGSTIVDFEIDPGYAKHESIEFYPDGWPDRWGRTI
ncbi:MAG: hypothetical protein GY701_21130 [Sulfitobacter sp.]|nr:hypothetical protein [Sulfitobacter sp.]